MTFKRDAQGAVVVPEVSSFLVVGVVDCLGGRTCLNVRLAYGLPSSVSEMCPPCRW